MKRALLIPMLLVAGLTLGGCGIRDAVGTVTATVTNPVKDSGLIQVEGAYSVALAISVSYRRYCYSKPLAELPATYCGNRRDIVRAMQTADSKAFAAITSARNFVRNNPTLSAVSAIAAARQAVADYTAATKPFQAIVQ